MTKFTFLMALVGLNTKKIAAERGDDSHYRISYLDGGFRNRVSWQKT